MEIAISIFFTAHLEILIVKGLFLRTFEILFSKDAVFVYVQCTFSFFLPPIMKKIPFRSYHKIPKDILVKVS